MSRPEEVAARFNDRINARDPVGLAELMQVYDDDTAANRKHLRL